jgi:hypothetical protein
MRTFRTILLITLAVLAVNAQSTEETKKTGPFTQYTLAREGWTKPIFADEFEEKEDIKYEFIGNILVSQKFYRSKNRILIQVELCNKEMDNQLTAEGNQFFTQLISLSSYEINGKIFAYKIHHPYSSLKVKDEYIILPDSTKPHGVGAAVFQYYIDKDGDGTFELNCDESPGLKTVPRWAAGVLADLPPPLKIKQKP